MPAAQNAGLFDWLTTLSDVGADGRRGDPSLDPCCDRGADALKQIEVAREMGFRFHASRGSMSIGQSKDGLPPDSLVDDEDAILADCERVIQKYPDPARYAMTPIVPAIFGLGYAHAIAPLHALVHNGGARGIGDGWVGSE